MRNILLLLVLLLSGLLAACSSGSSAPLLTSIAVTPPTASVAAGESQQFKAVGTFSNHNTQDLTAVATWSSSNTSVATVAAGAAKGLVANATAVTITATVGQVSGTGALTVTAPVLQSIAVAPMNAAVPVGTLAQFTATGSYSDGSAQDLTATATWGSSNTSVASIAAGGLATALTINATPVTITATSGTVSGSTGLTVEAATLTSIVISGEPTVTIADGTSYQFKALGFYNDGSKHYITTQVTWASSNPSAATIGVSTGRAQSVAGGGGMQTTITATLGSVVGTVTLDVTSATIQSIAVGPSSTKIAPLTTETFTAIGTFSDASTQNITQDVVWASSGAAATISNTSGSIGVATGVAPGGTTMISATFTFAGATASGSVPLDVTSATLQSIDVTPATAGLALGSTLALNAVATFSDTTKQNVSTAAAWSSSAPAVTLSENTATGASSGSALITCVLGGVTSNPAANLTVEGFTAITITPANGSVAEGTSIAFKATGTLTDGSTQDLTGSVQWTSSNPAVATMSNASGSLGSAAGAAPGTVTITAVFSGQIGTASLTVTDATLNTITIKPASQTITLGSRQQFTATGMFSDGTTENLTQQVAWTSSDPAVAIIDSSGAITTTGTGTTSIGASLNTVLATPAILTVQ